MLESPRHHDYLVSYILSVVSNLLLILPQYGAIQQVISSRATIPDSLVKTLIVSYGTKTGIILGLGIGLAVFLLVSGIFLLLTRYVGEKQPGWRYKYIVLSMSYIGYVGYALAASFLTSLDWASALAGSNVDTTSLIQSFYLFNLGAALCYLGVVLVLRRSYTRLSSLETESQLVVASS